MKYSNPIIPGFAPDPSIVQANGTFYLVTSSFHLFPGLPIYASKDLAAWTQIGNYSAFYPTAHTDFSFEGNAINRLSQLDLSGATTDAKILDTGDTMIATAGLWAPTIRFHKGTFYLLCTNCSRRGPIFEKRNFFITCEDILANHWSDPIYFDFDVIDPSIFFDDDNRAYIQGSWDIISRKAGSKKTQPSCTIKQIEVDIATGKTLSPPQEIWPGWAKYDSEGPHMYKKDGLYFLLVAEGGTFEHHLLSVARSRSVWGPFESYEQNPVLTADGKEEYIQNTGHGDLFQDCDGAWWAVLLGIRNEDGRFPLGRETFLTPVNWPENGWPEFSQPKMQFERGSTSSPSLTDVPPFKQGQLVDMVYIRVPALEQYDVSPGAKCISLQASQTDLSALEGSPSFIGKRQNALECSVTATLLLNSINKRESIKAGLALYKDSFRHAEIFLDFESEKIFFQLHNRTNGTGDTIKEASSRLELLATRIEFKIQAAKKSYTFAFRGGGGAPWVELMVIDTMEFTARDFTGTVFGVFASGRRDSRRDGKRDIVEFEDLELR